FLSDRGLLDEAQDDRLREAAAAEIQAAVERLEAATPPDPPSLFDHVYARPTPPLLRQRAELGAGSQVPGVGGEEGVGSRVPGARADEAPAGTRHPAPGTQPGTRHPAPGTGGARG